jgi:hypothetical protein
VTRSVVKSSASPLPEWLILIHHLPSDPAYLRAKVGRRLQRIGAIAVKNSVYVLPARDETYEDFQWLRQEIEKGGGSAAICEGAFLEGFSHKELIGLFKSAREEDYRRLLDDVDQMRREVVKTPRAKSEAASQVALQLRRLRTRFDHIAAVDFFLAPSRQRAQLALSAAEAALHTTATARSARPPRGVPRMRGRTWVTRAGVHVDRIASAWLIRRFIDPQATFKFVPATGYIPAKGELRFDMFEAEYTHEGEDCTFETLLRRFAVKDAGLQSLAELVHDIDVKDAKFRRGEVAGIELMIAGICAATNDDSIRVERGAALLDDLHAALLRGSELRTKCISRSSAKAAV